MRRARRGPALALTLAATLVLAGCGGGSSGQPLAVAGFVAVDEPLAAQQARDTLVAGGSAVDAMVAALFTMSVTFPGQVGLGAGGVCLHRPGKSGEIEALEFPATTAASRGARTDRPSGVPTLPRALFMLHQRGGKLPFGTLVQPAETLAREGFTVSRALSRQIQQAQRVLAADNRARNFLLRPDNRPLEPGDVGRNVDLAALFALLRLKGVGEFYSGPLARRLVDATIAVGGSLSAEELRDARPRWVPPVTGRLTVAPPAGETTAATLRLFGAPPPAAAGLSAAVMAQLASAPRALGSVPADERTHLQVEAAMRGFIDRQDWAAPAGDVQPTAVAADRVLSAPRIAALMAGYAPGVHATPEQIRPGIEPVLENPAGTGLVVGDLEGTVVACTVSLNNIFGTGRIAPGLGMFIAADPVPSRGGTLGLGPLMLLDQEGSRLRGAFASSGGVTAPTGLMRTLLGLTQLRETLPVAIAAPRLHHSGTPDTVYLEASVPEIDRNSLVARGYTIEVFPTDDARSPSRVNALWCTRGLPRSDPACLVATDPRGQGLAFGPVER